MSYNYRHRSGEMSHDDDRGFSGKRYGKPTSLSEKNSYVMEHLATFTVNKDAGIVHPLDGMRRLLQMEKSTGIWSQKMKLCLDSGCVHITDFETGDLIESFPAGLIQSPTAFTSEDVLELYNNVLVFIVSAGGSDQSEMHIFQSQGISAVNLVQDIKALQSNELQMPTNSSIMAAQSHSNEHFAIEYKNTEVEFQRHHGKSHKVNQKYAGHMEQHEDSDYFGKDLQDSYGVRSPGGTGNEFGPQFFEDTCSVSSEKYEREVNLLNNCFDDIEKFIARLQHTAAAVREVERRRHKKREIGDGLINLHTRPPMQKDFLEILAKFKLSFNLLSKLKTHIHDPNAPELVHFLFTPLALIVEAARDTYTDSQLATKVVDPLLTRETINFLINCVSSKETELWKSLGPSWTTPEEQWRDKRDFYHPEMVGGSFEDTLINKNNIERALAISRPEELTMENNSSRQNISSFTAARKYGHVSTESQELAIAIGEQNEYLASPQDTSDVDAGEMGAAEDKAAFDRLDASGMRSSFFNMGEKIMPPSMKTAPVTKSGDMARRINTFAEQWINELRIKGAHAVVVCYPRTANNDKELSVMKGEYLEILDDSRKWWKARNLHGQIGHVPSTIVTPIDYVNDHSSDLKMYDSFQK